MLSLKYWSIMPSACVLFSCCPRCSAVAVFASCLYDSLVWLSLAKVWSVSITMSIGVLWFSSNASSTVKPVVVGISAACESYFINLINSGVFSEDVGVVSKDVSEDVIWRRFGKLTYNIVSVICYPLLSNIGSVIIELVGICWSCHIILTDPVTLSLSLSLSLSLRM